MGREWLALQQGKLAPATYAKAVWTLETLVFPYIGGRPIAKLGATDVLKVLKRIEGRGRHETAHRTRQRCSQVFRYAVQTERAGHDVTADLRGALAPVVSEHHAAITEPARIGELLRAIDGYSGHPVTAYALKLAPLLFVRPGELRRAEWVEFDLDGSDPHWRIPAEKMKMGEQHVVPLAEQALTLLIYFPSMHSQRFNRSVTVTEHAAGRMTERGVDEAILLNLIETGDVRYKDEIRLWIAKHYSERADNLGPAAMKTTYYPQDDILEIRFSDKTITREVSQDWNINVSFADDGSIVELVILDAVKAGFMPFKSGEGHRSAA